jgi:serine/threonine protein kinase
MRDRVGSFRLLDRLGEGGMGVVYAAQDERLGRRVAIKMIREASTLSAARERFWREARAAARISHPNVCQIYDVGEDEGELWIAMELLEGQPLASRLESGPLPLGDAGPIALSMLSALEALHQRQIVHRDLKPTNVFLTPHGVKLLDFGLARTFHDDGALPDNDLTQTGFVMGTPRYMSPEQWKGQPADARTDLFAVGAILFEMLTGAPPFPGNSPAEARRATLLDPPPPLSGSPAVVAADRVIQRALAKPPADRYPSAREMAEAVRAALALLDEGEATRARTVTRLIVLPFRSLRPDAESDFLTFSLPDAITASLAGIETLVVRSHLSAAGFAGPTPDLKRIAEEADVDLVLTGTLLRAGDQMRVATQLLEAASGTVMWTQTTQVSMGDLFQLQDSLARQIVDSLSLPLASREVRTLQSDVPATAKAYEFYLRANELGRSPEGWTLARDLYLKCLQEDPNYAPAWAQLGRIYRVISKYTEQNAEENLLRAGDAFHRALSINPDLSMAHNLYVHLEVEMGRCQEAMTRLLDRARNRSVGAELYAGLTQACRYCGLLEPSVAASEHAKRLDPSIQTSVGYTYFMQGDLDRAIASDQQGIRFLSAYAYAAKGDFEEVNRVYQAAKENIRVEHSMAILQSQLNAMSGDRDASLAAARRVARSSFRDPEGLYFMARTYAYFHETDEALEVLRRVIESGYYQPGMLTRDAWLDPIRAHPEFIQLLRLSEARRREAVGAYFEHGGDRVLGVSPAA